jgi:hypothetical protein
METTFYVRTTMCNGVEKRSDDFATENGARTDATEDRKHNGHAVRVDVCLATGRIVAGWDRDETGMWTRTI